MPLRLGGSEEEGWSPYQHARLCADIVATQRTSASARLRFTKAAAVVTLTDYASRSGAGSATAPSVTVLGTGDTQLVWPMAYQDPYGNSIPLRFVSATASCNSATGGVATVQLTANTARVRTFTAAGVAADLPATVSLWGETGISSRAIGDYGGSPDKRESETEGTIPYAAQWYREFQAARGDAYTKKPGTLVHCENLALARLWAAWASRFPERRRANAQPHRSDDKLPYWVEALKVPTRADDPKWLIRQRCAAHLKAARGPSMPVIRLALAELIGDALVDVVQTQGADLATPPEQTYWPTVNPGPASYDLGGGAWLSRRAHVLALVKRPANRELGQFLQLLNVDMPKLLDTMLPGWATFAWTMFDLEAGFTGFFLDSSPLDLTGMTEP
jgi:hypothetical protein